MMPHSQTRVTIIKSFPSLLGHIELFQNYQKIFVFCATQCFMQCDLHCNLQARGKLLLFDEF